MDLSLRECADLLFKVSVGIRYKNSELAEIIYGIGQEVSNRADFEDSRDFDQNCPQMLIDISKKLEKRNKGLADVILAMSDVVAKEIAKESIPNGIIPLEVIEEDKEEINLLVEKIKNINESCDCEVCDPNCKKCHPDVQDSDQDCHGHTTPAATECNGHVEALSECNGHTEPAATMCNGHTNTGCNAHDGSIGCSTHECDDITDEKKEEIRSIVDKIRKANEKGNR